MQNTVIRVLVIFIVFLGLGIGGYYFFPNLYYNFFPPPVQQTSLTSLMDSNRSLSCTFEHDGHTGQFYLSGGKVRGEIDPTAPATKKSLMIFDGNYSYLWGEGEPTGIKVPFEPNDADPESKYLSTGVVDALRTYDYTCKSWRKEEDMFTPPSGVTFETPQVSDQNTSESGSFIILPKVTTP